MQSLVYFDIFEDLDPDIESDKVSIDDQVIKNEFGETIDMKSLKIFCYFNTNDHF